MLPLARTRMEQLNNNEYYSNPSMNKFGRLLTYYLCNMSYGDLYNNEPIDLMKNSYHKILARIKIIDNYIKKPLEEYTKDDLNIFMADFIEGRIKKASKQNLILKSTSLKFYIREFKRLWKIFRQYQIQNAKDFKPIDYEWGLLIRSPKIDRKKTYEKFPDLEVADVIDLANNMHKEEYRARVLLSVNLMGRKCEMQNLKKMMIHEKGDESIWVKLPNIKKHSSEKTEVELWTFVKRELLPYLKHNNFKNDECVFPSNDSAFGKNLRQVSERLFKHRINPKTLRKIGVCIAEKLGYGRADVERIGGWAANSDVLNHYFQRRPVAVIKEANNAVEKSLHTEIYTELERLKQERKEQQTIEKKKDEELHELKKKMEKLEKVSEFMNDFMQQNPSFNDLLVKETKENFFSKHKELMD